MSDTSFDLGTNSQVPLSTSSVDAAGNPVEGVGIVWSSSDPNVVTLEDQGDGTVIAVRAVKSAGSVSITATVTDANGNSATGSLNLTVADQGTGSGAISDVTIVPGTPS